jgi:hypothetical protein
MRQIHVLSVPLIFSGKNMNLGKSTEGLFLTSKEVDLEVNSGKAKYMFDGAVRV